MLVTFKHRYSLPGISFLNVKFSPVGGEHPKYIKSKLGHSSINVTMDIYGHLRIRLERLTPLILLEAAPGFEPGYNGFADRRLKELYTADPAFLFLTGIPQLDQLIPQTRHRHRH